MRWISAIVILLALPIYSIAAVSLGRTNVTTATEEQRRIFQFYEAQRSFKEKLEVGQQRYRQRQEIRAQAIRAMATELKDRQRMVGIRAVPAPTVNKAGPNSWPVPLLVLGALGVGLLGFGYYRNGQQLQGETVNLDRQTQGRRLETANLRSMESEDGEKVIAAASGLTAIQAEDAFALPVVENKRVDSPIVAREKAQAVKKDGLLEIIEANETLESIGGLDVLKEWLLKRRHAFSQRAVESALPTPKGLLIIGIPGTGKSLTAKAAANVFGVPLLKLEAGRICAEFAGQSESNLRSVIQTAETIAPCCLWIDKVEKGFSGAKSSSAIGGGTSSRFFASFISWMQEKKAPVFVVATANDVSQLPPEMLRKGKFDELFFIDLPNQQERKAICEIQIGKHGRDPASFDLVQLVKATEGLTGSEIENAFVEALYQALDSAADGGKEKTELDIARVLADFVPLSKLMAEEITGLRDWAKGRARWATSSVVERRGKKRS